MTTRSTPPTAGRTPIRASGWCPKTRTSTAWPLRTAPTTARTGSRSRTLRPPTASRSSLRSTSRPTRAPFIQWKPELGLNGGDSDRLDLSKPETTEVIQRVFSEFAPWFEGPAVHFGADEYPGNEDDYRNFFYAMAAFVRDDLGK